MTAGLPNTSAQLTVRDTRIVDQLSPFLFQLEAADAETGPGGLRFALETGPLGMTLDAKTGLMSWTPGEAEGPGTYPVVVRVTDDGWSPLTRSAEFRVEVREVNSAPKLGPIANSIVKEGER